MVIAERGGVLSNHLKIKLVAILKGRFATTCIGSLPNSTSDNSRASAQMTFNRGFAICSSSLRICMALLSFSTAIT